MPGIALDCRQGQSSVKQGAASCWQLRGYTGAYWLELRQIGIFNLHVLAMLAPLDAKTRITNHIVGFCNCKRISSALGNLPPSACEQTTAECEPVVVSEIT